MENEDAEEDDSSSSAIRANSSASDSPPATLRSGMSFSSGFRGQDDGHDFDVDENPSRI
jgi:hypothetical protein